jgi:hypothetical protein
MILPSKICNSCTRSKVKVKKFIDLEIEIPYCECGFWGGLQSCRQKSASLQKCAAYNDENAVVEAPEVEEEEKGVNQSLRLKL